MSPLIGDMDDWLATSEYFMLVAAIGLVLTYLAPATLSNRKGYAWSVWMFSGFIGLIVLAFLPFIRLLSADSAAEVERKRIGDRIGVGISAFTIIVGTAVAIAANESGRAVPIKLVTFQASLMLAVARMISPLIIGIWLFQLVIVFCCWLMIKDRPIVSGPQATECSICGTRLHGRQQQVRLCRSCQSKT